MTTLHEITNAAFLDAIFKGLRPDERIWFNAASGNPNADGFIWKGQKAWPNQVQDYPHGNAYFSVAAFKDSAAGRKGDFFSRLFVVVLDDPERIELAPSWTLRTSENKRQIGFILSEPISDVSVAKRLAIALAENGLINVDKSGNNLVRYVRLPIGHNGKHTPPYPCQLEQFNPERVFHLDELADTLQLDLDAILTGKTEGNHVTTTDKAGVDDAELWRRIANGENYHDPILLLTKRMVARGMRPADVVDHMKGVMEAHKEDSERWKSRFNDVMRLTYDAVEKYAPSAVKWPAMADPFAEQTAPAFPVDCLPTAFQEFVTRQSTQSGFDEGGYAFSLLIAAANMLDHRVKLNVTDDFAVPPMLWGGLADASGGGKSPIIKASSKEAARIDSEVVKASTRATIEWEEVCANLGKGEAMPQRPAWKQRHALDTTVEALADLLVDNPEGINIFADELTEWIGRQDAYSAGGGKDRGVYLRAYDGGSITINRKNKHHHIENFSIGLLAGIQPEKLAELFKKSGAGGADGLYQRILFYSLRSPGPVNYSAGRPVFEGVNVGNVFDRIHTWNMEGHSQSVAMREETQSAMEAFHNNIRTLALRTSAPRFREHLNKYPGFVARITLALHALDCITDGPGYLTPFVELATFRKAEKIMRVLYRHSEAIYALLDSQAGTVQDLARSAAEAILSKQWERFQRGDLTRNATHWQGAPDGAAENALDLLIEYGWIADITPPAIPGKRGRKSDGVFLVNPATHQQFKGHAERIAAARQERHTALKTLAEGRNELVGKVVCAYESKKLNKDLIKSFRPYAHTTNSTNSAPVAEIDAMESGL